MSDLTVKRTLVKSPPELWTELSELESLARHLGELGEIKISRLEPEHTVAWEGENARGVVEIEASGWGTKVTMTAEVETTAEAEAASEPSLSAVDEESEPTSPWPDDDYLDATEWVEDTPLFAVPERRKRSWRRWLRRRTRKEQAVALEGEAVEPEPVPIAVELVREVAPVAEEPNPISEPEPSAETDRVLAVLESTLDNLGQAHHRPFSRG